METWNILAITDAFLDQKRVNECKHAVKMVSMWVILKVATRGCEIESGEGWEVGENLPCVHIHLLSSDRERHLWLLKYFKFLCVYEYFRMEITLLQVLFKHILIILIIKSLLKWRKDRDTYLTTVCRHRWSRQITMKVYK